MDISQKCQYGLRAIFELSLRKGLGPIKIGDIAKAQAIPVKFLELILGELRHGGFVESRRGAHGGYMLAVEPAELTAGQITTYIDGAIIPVKCMAAGRASKCPLESECVFMDMWVKARDAVVNVYNGTTFQDLIEKKQSESCMLDFCI